jgi:hypothetical protein
MSQPSDSDDEVVVVEPPAAAGAPPRPRGAYAHEPPQRLSIVDARGTYTGEMMNWRPHGEGKWVSPVVTVEGDFREGQPHGDVSCVWACGDTFVGKAVGGLMEGRGRYRWASGATYEGEWLSGERSGHGVAQWPSGALYKGYFAYNKFEGRGEFRLPRGAVFVGHFKKNLFEGHGVLKRRDDAYEGLWERDKKHGRGVETMKDGTTYFGTWVRGKRDGAFIVISGPGEGTATHREVWDKNILKSRVGAPPIRRSALITPPRALTRVELLREEAARLLRGPVAPPPFLCVTCASAPPAMIFVECGHLVCCEGCANFALRACPVCHVEVGPPRRVFL